MQTEEEAEVEEDLSDDELPPDVDLSDPFFAEELAGGGNHVTFTPDQSECMSLQASGFFLFWSSVTSVVLNNGNLEGGAVVSRAGKKLTGLVVFTDMKKSQKGKKKGKKKETEEEPTAEEEEELQKRRVSFPASFSESSS